MAGEIEIGQNARARHRRDAFGCYGGTRDNDVQTVGWNTSRVSNEGRRTGRSWRTKANRVYTGMLYCSPVLLFSCTRSIKYSYSTVPVLVMGMHPVTIGTARLNPTGILFSSSYHLLVV